MSRHPLPRQSLDFPGWYGAIGGRAGLAESSLVRGATVIKPYGYAIGEAIQRALDQRMKATGHENLYFPLFVATGARPRRLARHGVGRVPRRA